VIEKANRGLTGRLDVSAFDREKFDGRVAEMALLFHAAIEI